VVKVLKYQNMCIYIRTFLFPKGFGGETVKEGVLARILCLAPADLPRGVHFAPRHCKTKQGCCLPAQLLPLPQLHVAGIEHRTGAVHQHFLVATGRIVVGGTAGNHQAPHPAAAPPGVDNADRHPRVCRPARSSGALPARSQ